MSGPPGRSREPAGGLEANTCAVETSHRFRARLGRLGRRLGGVFAPRGRDGFKVPPLRQEADFGEMAELPVTEFERAPDPDQQAIARRILRSRLYPPRS